MNTSSRLRVCGAKFESQQVFTLHASMPRKYVRKGGRGGWTDQQLQGAIRAVKEQGQSINAASQRFGIPKSTLYNHCSGEIFNLIEGGKHRHILHLFD